MLYITKKIEVFGTVFDGFLVILIYLMCPSQKTKIIFKIVYGEKFEIFIFVITLSSRKIDPIFMLNTIKEFGIWLLSLFYSTLFFLIC